MANKSKVLKCCPAWTKKAENISLEVTSLLAYWIYLQLADGVNYDALVRTILVLYDSQ